MNTSECSTLTASLLELYQGLEVQKESRASYRSHFLDLDVVVNDGRLVVATYDKGTCSHFKDVASPTWRGMCTDGGHME